MKMDEMMKEILQGCKYIGICPSDDVILECATKIFTSDKNIIKLGEVDDENTDGKMRKFLEGYKDIIIKTSLNQHDYNMKMEVLNDVKLYLDGRFKFWQ